MTALAAAQEEENVAPPELTSASGQLVPGTTQVDRPDLYSDNWDGDKYKGSGWNELTGLLAIGILVPVVGLVIALATRGTLWGLVSFY